MFFLMLMLIAPPFARSEASGVPPMLEVVGIFEGIDETTEPKRIVLVVGDNTASGPIMDGCSFINEKGKNIDIEAFVRSYLKRYVTLNLLESTGEVFSCQVNR